MDLIISLVAVAVMLFLLLKFCRKNDVIPVEMDIVKPDFTDCDSPELEVVESEIPELEGVETEGPEPEVLESEIPELEGVETEGSELEVVESEIPELEGVETEAPELEVVESEIPELEGVENEDPELEVVESEIPELEGVETEDPELEVAESEIPELEGVKTENPELEVVENEVIELDMVKIPGRDIKMLRTEVTQELYEKVIGFNPSYFQPGRKSYGAWLKEPYVITEGEDPEKLPVDSVSWYDAIYFCNKLSVMNGLEPVYAIGGNTDVAKCGYEPNVECESWNDELEDKGITWILTANGYRLPTVEEWRYSTKGGQKFRYAGSNILDEVGWYRENSNFKTHTVALKKPNGYGLYDMIGNVWEWCWDSDGSNHRYYRGGGYDDCGYDCKGSSRNHDYANSQSSYLGFRIVCSASK